MRNALGKIRCIILIIERIESSAISLRERKRPKHFIFNSALLRTGDIYFLITD